jgi:hypothetical protein
MVKLALYKGKGKIGNAITRWWTGSIYSHCELVILDVCHSASFMDGGVRAKVIDLQSGNWDVIALPWVDAEQVLSFFRQTEGRAYDWLGLFRGQLFNRGERDGSKYFCSEWCTEAIGVPAAEMYSPARLGELCDFLRVKGE